MSHVHLRRSHGMTLERAREVATRMAESLRRDHGLDYAWRNSVLHFSGPGLAGRLEIDNSKIDLLFTLSWALRPFRARLERSVRERLDALIDSS